MEIPIRFPSERDKIFEEAKDFQSLSSDERFRRIFDLIESGILLMKDAPNQEAMKTLENAYENQWQQAQKELFARHGV